MEQRFHIMTTGKLSALLLASIVVITLDARAEELEGGPSVSEPGVIVEEDEPIVEAPGQAEEELSRQFRLDEPGITGIILDRTITMTGRTFSRQFSQQSLDRPLLSNATLTIHERPSARWGSQIWITQGNRVVFQATMPPRLSDIDQYVEAALEQVEQLVVQQRILDAFDSDPDLADEEI